MHSLFTTQGNGRLYAGEVAALAGFHKGLSGSSQGKIHDRVVELYQGSHRPESHAACASHGA